MNKSYFPQFDTQLAELNRFILSLADGYHAGKINTWDKLDEHVKAFFTPERMDEVETIVPGWKRMASYEDGVTLTHVICVFLGLFIMPEFQELTVEQRQLAKWIVLFHDVEKVHIRGKRDSMHMSRSAVTAANALPDIGFLVTGIYQVLIHAWSELTNYAYISKEGPPEDQIPDNSKLPEIIADINNMFGEDTPATLIVKGVLLHQSVNTVKAWPPPAPLTDEEIKLYFSKDLFPLLKVMNLADNEGWTIFSPGRETQRSETLEAFERVEKLIAQPT